VVTPFLDFTGRRYWLAILAFIALFKLGEALAGVMVTPFYRSEGFTRNDVASVATVFGLVATLTGAVAGSWLVGRIGVGRALILTGIGQMLSNLMYLALVGGGRDMGMLFAQVGVENFTDGLADAAFLTYLSGLVNRSFSATQYALLSSLAAVPLRTLGASAGVLAASLGWTQFFILTTLAALPAMAIMIFLLRRLPPDERRTDRPDPAAASLG
jgi:PAT family beta-lactamase induction signal transducer AmpG